jgi:hypothetical protein
MSREIIQEALNGIRDEYITEAGARLGLLAVGAAGAVGAASGAAVDPSTLYSLSGTEAAVKTGFGAWLAKGGWIALVAGAVAAAGIAVGAFLLGSDGFEWPTFPQGIETTETASDESEPEEETEAPDLSYFQFPLTSADDTTSYVSITDSGNNGCKTVEFLVNGSSGLRSVLTFASPKNSEANIQIVAFKTDTRYGFIYMYERVVTGDLLTGEGEEITVMMEGYHLRFDKAGNVFFNPDLNTRTCHFTGNTEKTVTLAQYRYNEAMLDRVKDIRDAYNDLGSCEYTILYRYVDGEETVNTPVESIPDFPFTIFNSYNQPDPEN